MEEQGLILNQKTVDFVTNVDVAKSPVAVAAKFLIHHTRKHRLNYDQLSRVFRIVRERCNIEVPKPNRNELIELPTEEELKRFYNSIPNPIHKLVFKVLEGTGLRIAELVSLEVSRIDFQTNQLFVSEGKG